MKEKSKSGVEVEERTAKKPKIEVKGHSETFNNPGLLLRSLCFAEMSVWNVYDDLSVQRSKNELILTRSEKKAIDDSTFALLGAYMNLTKIVERRMKSEMSAKEGDAK